MIFETGRISDPRRYNAPNTNEIAFVFKDNNGIPPFERDLKAYKNSCEIQLNNKYNTKKIDTLMNICEPMCYPILYPYGDLGWDKNMPHKCNFFFFLLNRISKCYLLYIK